MSRIRLTCTALAVTVLGVACANSPPMPRSASASRDPNVSPLGPSYVLLPLPSDDDALLGRILHDKLEPGRTLEEISRPNPCAQHLSDAKESPLANRYEDAQELAAGAQAGAMLGAFGFAGDAKQASFFVYKIRTDKRVGRTDTNEYVACCQENECGYGFVSALIYGDGEYATAEESSAKGSASIGVASAGGYLSLRVLNRRNVHGWIAALVTITDKDKAGQVGAMGAAGSSFDEANMPPQVRDIYENNKVVVHGTGSEYVFAFGSGDELTENEFIRRYREITGSGELDDARKRRNWGPVAMWGGFTAAGLGVLTFGMMNLKRDCSDSDVTNLGMEEPCQVPAGTPGAKEGFFSGTYYDPNEQTNNPWGPFVAAFGGVMAATFGTFLVVELLDPDGDPVDHNLTDGDARLYAGRYNRAFLRKTVRDVGQSARGPSLQLRPWIASPDSPGLGFTGRF